MGRPGRLKCPTLDFFGDATNRGKKKRRERDRDKEKERDRDREKEREKRERESTLVRPGTYAYTSENGYVIRRN